MGGNYGERSTLQPCQPPGSAHSGCTLIIRTLVLFTFSFFTPFFLWRTHCSLSALSAAAVASLKVCLRAVNNHLFNNVRTIRRWFYANFFRRSIHLHYLHFYSLSTFILVPLMPFQYKIRLLTKFRDQYSADLHIIIIHGCQDLIKTCLF